MGKYIFQMEGDGEMLTIKHGSKKSLPQMKSLWREVFGDGEDFIALFFERFYSPQKTLLLFEGEELISMLFYMNVDLKYNKKKLKCAYLYGVATKLSERRRGHFTRLHEKLVRELKNRNYDAVVTIPANDSLFSFYKDYGYTISFKRFEYQLKSLDLIPLRDPTPVWEKRKEEMKRSKEGLYLLETKEQFMVSRRGHRFFKSGESYLSFAPEKKGWVLYEVVGDSVPTDLVHYERSAALLDLKGIIDEEAAEKQKPSLSYLLN